MNTSGHPAPNHQNAKELDSMKESISDIINQLQDIDPTRLSFSPFLDLDTQISLAPVSDSPESSVEELHSSSHSVSSSQQSLQRSPAQGLKSPASHHQQNYPPQQELRVSHPEEEQVHQRRSTPTHTINPLEAPVENCTVPQTPAPRGDIPNGTNPPRRSPEPTTPDCCVDEVRPLISPPPDSVELSVWRLEGREENCTEAEADEASHRGKSCCHCSQSACCWKGRVPAFLSVFASLLSSAGIVFALYSYVPVRLPDYPSIPSRIVFSLCCCVVAALPVMLAMLVSPACLFCSGSLDVLGAFPRRQKLQQLFVTASLQLLLLYVLNLVVMASLLEQEHLKLVPIVVVMFIIGRLVYWFSLNTCSFWRGFGSGLTVFPLLAMVAVNLFLMYEFNSKEPIYFSQDVVYNQLTPTPWSMETSHSP